jgi:hypothetical protein
MPARIMRQNKEIKELFREKIREKVAREKDAMRHRIDEETPSWISWALKPVAGIAFDWKHQRDSDRGESGESQALLNFWLFLSKDWILINDVVLEPEPEEFIQVDHILIGPPGIYLIETKAWDGAFLGFRDNWKRKEGSGWVRCESPTRQNQRHRRLLKKWLQDNTDIPDPLIEQSLFPIVLFTRAKWLKANECSMPVFESGLALSLYIRRQTKNTLLLGDQIQTIADHIISAGPLMTAQDVEMPPVTPGVAPSSSESAPKSERRAPTTPVPVSQPASQGPVSDVKVKTGRTRDGRCYVRVIGSKDEAEAVRMSYAKDGKTPGPLKADRFTGEAWFFYLE